MAWFKKSSPREGSAPSPKPETQSPIKKGATYLGKNLVVNGTIAGRDDVQIFGRHTGGIQLEGDLDIRQSAAIQGNLKARTISVGGIAEGDLIAGSTVHIQRTGKVEGNVSTPALELKEGAVLNGKVNMDTH